MARSLYGMDRRRRKSDIYPNTQRGPVAYGFLLMRKDLPPHQEMAHSKSGTWIQENSCSTSMVTKTVYGRWLILLTESSLQVGQTIRQFASGTQRLASSKRSHFPMMNQCVRWSGLQTAGVSFPHAIMVKSTSGVRRPVPNLDSRYMHIQALSTRWPSHPMVN